MSVCSDEDSSPDLPEPISSFGPVDKLKTWKIYRGYLRGLFTEIKAERRGGDMAGQEHLLPERSPFEDCSFLYTLLTGDPIPLTETET